jgi:hypothetical protein
MTEDEKYTWTQRFTSCKIFLVEISLQVFYLTDANPKIRQGHILST